MNILLSAYACEPNKGSEPGVGWSWAIELAKDYKVWVITRDNNKETIDSYLNDNPQYKNDNLNFIYVGLSRKLTFWKKGRRGMRLFYMLWQRKAAKVAIELNKSIKFDLVQHITFVSYTQPTYMYKLGIPMIWGPVAGGENIPPNINIKMTIKEKIIEGVRMLSQKVAMVTPCILKTMKLSKVILVATEETKRLIPNKYSNKTFIMPAIGSKELDYKEIVRRDCRKIKIVMAGRLIYWKAFDIGINAFIKIANKYENIELYILGEGEEKDNLKKLCSKFLNKRIFFLEPIEHDKIYDFYSEFDIFLNTTLRDSGCMTMLEAMTVGLPCVNIASGGPKILSSGIKELQVEIISYEQCVEDISHKLEKLFLDKDLRNRLGEKCKINSEKFSYKEKVKNIQKYIDEYEI